MYIIFCMSDAGETFFTSIGCMDGRVQDVAAEFGRKKWGAQYPDTITEAGLVGDMAGNPSSELLDAIKKKVLISVEKHHSRGILVHGHQKCAGNPIDDDLHKKQTLKSTEIISSMAPNIEVVPLFIIHTESGWEATEL
jgi:hypothetical protein